VKSIGVARAAGPDAVSPRTAVPANKSCFIFSSRRKPVTSGLFKFAQYMRRATRQVNHNIWLISGIEELLASTGYPPDPWKTRLELTFEEIDALLEVQITVGDGFGKGHQRSKPFNERPLRVESGTEGR
jgi:hypothetical protein